MSLPPGFAKKLKKAKLNLPEPEELPEFTAEHRRDFKKMEENCYKHLHKPRVVKITNWGEDIFYICKECLDKYMKEHEELKKTVVSFGR